MNNSERVINTTFNKYSLLIYTINYHKHNGRIQDSDQSLLTLVSYNINVFHNFQVSTSIFSVYLLLNY